MAKAETLVDRYFAQCYQVRCFRLMSLSPLLIDRAQSAKKGTIEVCGERYLLFRYAPFLGHFVTVCIITYRSARTSPLSAYTTTLGPRRFRQSSSRW